MLGNWFKRRAQLASIKAVTADIERFILSLRGQSDEENGMLVAIAAIVRVNLRADNLLPDEALGIGTPLAETAQAEVQLRMSQLVQQFQKHNQLSDAAAAMVWLHSLRAFRYPEVRPLGRQMWGELGRGFPHIFDAFRLIEEATGKPPPAGALQASQFIPVGLEPFEPSPRPLSG